MAYTHPDALQRICEEIENTVWVSDRQFFHDHPTRAHRVRPAMEAEIHQCEITEGKVAQCPQGRRFVTVVKQLHPAGIRMRIVLHTELDLAWSSLSEDICRDWWDWACAVQGSTEKMKQLELEVAAMVTKKRKQP